MNLKESEWLTHTEELQATCQQLEELGALMEARRIKGRIPTWTPTLPLYLKLS